MESKKENAPLKLLDYITQPAFGVKDGQIVQVNEAARLRFLEPGTDVTQILAAGQAEYAAFTGGCLYLNVTCGGSVCGASVTRAEGFDLFVLEPVPIQEQLQAIALAARELRAPLFGVLTATDQLFPAVDRQASAAEKKQMARINRGLFQLQRVISNMSDAYRYAADSPGEKETRDICALVDEILEKAAALAAEAGFNLHYQGLPKQLYCLIDPQLIERAVYNMISNAMKFTPKGGRIDAVLRHRGDRVYLTVQDSGPGIPDSLRGSVFSRYLREPGIEDGRFGIGLGLVLVRAAAAAHDGTVLIEQPEDAGTRITMTVALRQRQDNVFSSPFLSVDYAGERDHGLLELSDVLPTALYYPEDIN